MLNVIYLNCKIRKGEFLYEKENFNNSLQIAEILNDEKITTLNTSEKVLNLLSENKNNWEIQDEQIVFDNDSLSNQYDELINSL